MRGWRVLLGPINRKIKGVVANSLFFILQIMLAPFPRTTLVRLKATLSPVIQLDYNRYRIFLHADSPLSLYRARACQKEPETVSWIEECVKPGEVFYDIGANVGAYSLIACKHCDGDLTVYAFEPSFTTYYQLCRNVILNACEQSVTPHMICLAELPQMVTFNYSSLEGGSALHTMGEATVDGLGNQIQPIFRQKILGFNIDHLVTHFDFPVPNHIKLDVDGTELEILYGASNTLDCVAVKSILVEVGTLNRQADVVAEFLQDKGFYIASKTDRGDGTTWNYVFRRSLKPRSDE